MIKLPKVSVIIPVYNAKDYLGRCLDSVINQTLKDIEIICINDCSKDNSLEILKEYSSKDKRIKLINHKTNKGESAARNTGLDNAKGEYIAFLDNDDTIDSNFYEKLYKKATETNADIVKGEVHIIGYDGSESYGDLNEKIRKNNSKLYFAYFWWTAIYKASLIKDNNISFLENYPLGGDVLFLNQAILQANKLALVDGCFYNYYRRADSGDSLELSFDKIKSVLDIHEKILDNTLKSKYMNTETDAIYFLCNWHLKAPLVYMPRNKTIEVYNFCSKMLCRFYNKIKNQININNLTTTFLPVVTDYLEHSNYEGLAEFYMTNDTEQKILIANLRYSHSKKVNQ